VRDLICDVSNYSACISDVGTSL